MQRTLAKRCDTMPEGQQSGLTPPSEKTRARMMAQAKRDTSPELTLRRALHRRGLRYRVDVSPAGRVRGRADVVFPREKIAIYVDGCFWHQCPEHGSMPRSNRAWWRAKLEENVARDRRVDQQLTAAGWLVLRVWEHEDPEEAADRIERHVRDRRS